MSTKPRRLSRVTAAALAGASLFGLAGATSAQADNPQPGYARAGTSLNEEAEQPVLNQGKRGYAVRNLQRLLTAHGHPVTVDGDFGPRTQSALVAFQRARHLAADGVAGRQTWRALLTPQPGKPLPQLQSAETCWETVSTETNYAYRCDFSVITDPAADLDTLKTAVFQATTHHFNSTFTFSGCGPVLKKGIRCELRPPGAPIEVADVGSDSFTIRSLPGHPEGANRLIRFTLFTQADQLRLRVHAQGPPSPIGADKATVRSRVGEVFWRMYAKEGLYKIARPS
ncbi:peptidoglycan-binding protein (plasmid) [Streptomyces cellulosae]|uniref:peptidoglycan-binding domain-containing protein n=1 Tax=Streptomyces cellulosae TaxID=1968 RepID=UPI002ED24BC9|nr:peptidoglycan-binding protein [Streptomyces cellulosae]WTB73736.1 peptidoglycan-binding protein [Streptomyces cellulosae]